MLTRLATACLLACALATPLAAQIDSLTVGERRYLAQKATGDTLRLHANSCFFDGPGLQCKGQGPAVTEGDRLNGGKSFDTIAGIAVGNQVSWYVHVLAAGECEVELQASNDVRTQAALELLIDERRIPLNAKTATLRFDRAGVHRIRLSSTAKAPLNIHGLALTGDAIQGASLLRTRWRPAAAHAKFSSSSLEAGTRVWIMEMDAAPGDARFYAPMTTPFGYFGPSWTAEGIPTGMNFSMWSFGRGKQEPPIEQLSHLLAVGHPSARFDGFGHEGTGVKLRGWNPFEQWRGQSCVLALRMELGDPYDTYSGYLFDENDLTWKLFCAGRKHTAPKQGRRRTKANANRTLRPGSFVEVPGPPQRQRTGHIVREMRYRGFALDEQRTPHALDQISGRNKQPVGNQGRGITDDGRFRLWMGGMEQFEESRAQSLEQSLEQPLEQPHDTTSLEWMKPEKLAALFTWPTTIKLKSALLKNGILRVTCDAKGLGKANKVRLYVGAKDGLTFANRWDQALDIPDLADGEVHIMKQVPATARFARILVENEHGKFWSMESLAITVE
ncbi:MAG: hypothetical protein ACI8UD_002459 [Planctomycetota bacterium]|jgi:hypothetical protein